MKRSKKYVVVLVTAKNISQARKISNALLERKLIACANIVNPVESLFWWQGKVDHAREVMLVMKSRQDLFRKIVEAVKSLHSYENPEVIAMPVVQGSGEYLTWIDQSLIS